MAKKELSRAIKDVEILITDHCNMRCGYCYHTKTPREMSDQTMESILGRLKDKCDETVMFTFFGGEPLLRTDFVMKWIERCRQEMPKCKISISTNGTVFDEKFVTWWKELPNTSFQISYDGVCQEKNRGHADAVRENIRRYIQLLGPGRVRARITYYREDVERLCESMADCYALGFRGMFAQPAMLPGQEDKWTEQDFVAYAKQVDKIYEFCHQNPDAEITNYDSELILKRSDCRECGMGRTILAIDPEGNTFPCHRMVGCGKFNLGNMNTENLHRGNFLHLVMPSTCHTCYARGFCSPCHAANYKHSGSFCEPIKYICRIGAIDYMAAQVRHNATYKKVYDRREMLETMVKVMMDVKKSNTQVLEKLKCLIY